MTTRQIAKVVEQLRIALEVMMLNISADQHRPLVKVDYKGISTNFKITCFTYHIHCHEMAFWDTRKFANEVEKILPNVRVTEVFVFFFSRSIRVNCKELGKRGTYSFDFVQVRS